MTKQLGARIALSEATAHLVRDRYAVEPKERMAVRGRSRTEEVYVMADRSTAA
jgi:hypothetical protein